MPQTVLNQLLSLATVDEHFCQELLSDPLDAALRRNFVLSQQEQDLLCSIQAHDLADLSQQLLNRLR